MCIKTLEINLCNKHLKLLWTDRQTDRQFDTLAVVQAEKRTFRN